MTNFWQAVNETQKPKNGTTQKPKIEYRLYYDVNGDPMFYTVEDEEGQYIVVNKETYTTGRYDVTVVNGKLVKPTQTKFKKLVPSDNGTETTTYDLSIIGPGRYWKIKHYE